MVFSIPPTENSIVLCPATRSSPRLKLDEVQPFSTFTVFPKLPLELRLLIFKHALPESTDLAIKGYAQDNHTPSDPTTNSHPPNSPSPHSPVIFFVFIFKNPGAAAARQTGLLGDSIESRGVYLKNFPLRLPFIKNGTHAPSLADQVGMLHFSLTDILSITNFELFILDPKDQEDCAS